jgi:tRNA(Arg) A34 adenosine deaminase TadA
MSSQDKINRRDFLVTTAGAAGTVSAFTGAALAQTEEQPPSVPVLDPEAKLAEYWEKPVFKLAEVDFKKAAPELKDGVVKERHQIYCFLLMKLMKRFWNGNKQGPVGLYPQREKQKEEGQDQNAEFFRYVGDRFKSGDSLRVSWDRYVGHNIACLAVDGNGEVIDFDFNHNDFFRSSAEHAESRMVRRLFSLTDIFDSWKTGARIPDKSRAFSLKSVTLYTSLESCAQCSGVMSLARVRQVVYLQRDPGTYVIGNIMYNLAGRDNQDSPMAPIPVPASVVGVPHFDKLNADYATFFEERVKAGKNQDKKQAFFVSQDGHADFSPAITSFLCTDDAYNIFADGGEQLDTMQLEFPGGKPPQANLTNLACLDEARRFYQYADVEGFRGSPHKL